MSALFLCVLEHVWTALVLQLAVLCCYYNSLSTLDVGDVIDDMPGLMSAALLNQADLGWCFLDARCLDQSASTTASSQLVELTANLGSPCC